MVVFSNEAATVGAFQCRGPINGWDLPPSQCFGIDEDDVVLISLS
jgi:hypothetical protein